MADEAPKSAYELAMERLRKKDQEAGVEERRLTDEQRAAIAEARKVAEARWPSARSCTSPSWRKACRTPRPARRWSRSTAATASASPPTATEDRGDPGAESRRLRRAARRSRLRTSGWPVDGRCLRSRAVGDHAVLGHDHDPLADVVAVAVPLLRRPPRSRCARPRPMRAFLSMMALSITESVADARRAARPSRVRALDLLERLVVVGAQDQAVADARARARCGCGCRSPRARSPRPPRCSPRRAARCCTTQLLDLGRGQEARVRVDRAARRRRSRRAARAGRGPGWPGSRSGWSPRPPSSRGGRGPARACCGTASGMTWRPKSTSAASASDLLQRRRGRRRRCPSRPGRSGPTPGTSETRSGSRSGGGLLLEVDDAALPVHLQDAEARRPAPRSPASPPP